MNTGEKLVRSNSGLITTIAACLERNLSSGSLKHSVQYALEGSVFTAGALIQWLRDELRLINNAAESEKYAVEAGSNAGVYIVPAFSGLGAPYWDMHARGAMFGITRGTNRNHIIRAALEAIAYQTRDILDAMQADIGKEIKELSVDGGASANNFLIQFQADILGKIVSRPATTEATAIGAAYLAGLSVGVWESTDELKSRCGLGRKFIPNLSIKEREELYAGYKNAVKHTLTKGYD
jgi:glycerol kinase